MKMNRPGKIMVCMLLLFVGITFVSCSKISEENFNKIQNGMSQEEVYKILGKPTESDSGTFVGISGTSSKWKREGMLISIQFLNGKVRLKNLNKDQ